MTTNTRNPGMPLDLDWVAGAHVNKSAVERRVATVQAEGEAGIALAQVDHAKLQGEADLLGGEADALRFLHRFHHVVGELVQRGIEDRDRPALLAQDGIAKLNNSQGHVV